MARPRGAEKGRRSREDSQGSGRGPRQGRSRHPRHKWQSGSARGGGEALAEAKKLERQASKADKAANTGLGLRTVWEMRYSDEEAALTWAYDRNPDAFLALVLDMRGSKCGRKRELPGIKIWSEKVAR